MYEALLSSCNLLFLRTGIPPFMSLLVTIFEVGLARPFPPNKPLNIGKTVFFPGSCPGLSITLRFFVYGESILISLENPVVACGWGCCSAATGSFNRDSGDISSFLRKFEAPVLP